MDQDMRFIDGVIDASLRPGVSLNFEIGEAAEGGGITVVTTLAYQDKRAQFGCSSERALQDYEEGFSVGTDLNEEVDGPGARFSREDLKNGGETEEPPPLVG